MTAAHRMKLIRKAMLLQQGHESPIGFEQRLLFSCGQIQIRSLFRIRRTHKLKRIAIGSYFAADWAKDVPELPPLSYPPRIESPKGNVDGRTKRTCKGEKRGMHERIVHCCEAAH